MSNRPCLDKNKLIDFIHTFSDSQVEIDKFMDMVMACDYGWWNRGIAATLIVFCKNKEDELCVLASERGKDAADYQGYWNCCCGYVDCFETTKETAIRECKEECGIDIDPNIVKFFDFEDDPYKANNQNISFHYYARVLDKTTDQFVFSKDGNEGEEVGNIAWIKVSEIDKYQWAFHHDELIANILKRTKHCWSIHKSNKNNENKFG